MKKTIFLILACICIPIATRNIQYNSILKKTSNQDTTIYFEETNKNLKNLKKTKAKIVSLLTRYLEKYKILLKSTDKFTSGDSITTILLNLNRLITLKKIIENMIKTYNSENLILKR